ncbi:hypothetical protein MMC24_004598 [Lignoscripta atroalba]|nr:hypothetical protein [Lignoscripta atroalba]
MAGMCTAFGTGVSSVHDPGYVQMWRKQREEAIARGEDPDAQVEAKIQARKEKSTLGKIQRFLNKEKGYKPGASLHLSTEEEEEARSRDRKRLSQDDGVIR